MPLRPDVTLDRMNARGAGRLPRCTQLLLAPRG